MEQRLREETTIPQNKTTFLPCGECDRENRHKVLAETYVHLRSEDGEFDLETHYQIVQCQGCLTVTFCEASEFSDDLQHDPETGKAYVPVKRKYYPSRIAGRPLVRETHHLPGGVRSIYQEAHAALCAELPVMAGFGIRAIVEAVCIDREMKGRDLSQRIDGLAEAGFITSAGATILHNLRFMGNAAAHEMRAHSAKELNAAFDVVEYLLQGVYILPQQAAHLPKS